MVKMKTMKNILIMLLLTTGVYAQKQVFNVQQYCIDEKPLQNGDCDIKGNEYSFVFLDVKKSEVVLFLSDIKFVYQIIASKKDANYTLYALKNGVSHAEMRLNGDKTKIEFLQPSRHIKLTVGKSTKLPTN
jgi:hypothetical protein